MNMASRMGAWFKNVFFAHEGNGHKPHLLRPVTVAFVVLVVVAAEAGLLFTAKYLVPRTQFFGLVDANALVDETNQQRVANNFPALTVSPLLTAAAQDKANDMAKNGYFAHTSPSGLTPWYWFEQVGYAFSFAGENLAVNFTDSQAVTDAWMNSPEHRANILDGNYTQVGIATAQGTYNGQPATFVAEEFGTPASQPIAFLNSASAATAPVATTTPTSSLPKTGTVVIPPPTPATTKPASKPKPVAAVAAVVPSSSVAPTGSQPVSIVVSAAALAPTSTMATGTATSAVPAITGGTIRSAPQTNALQRLISNPAALTNYFYIALIVLFAAALVLNMFVKVRVRYPHLILGGMVVVVVAGLLVIFNQNLGILHAVIL